MQDTYAGMPLDEALRKLVREFKLPGEAQQIDRIMEKFADAYCRHNPGTFRAAEDAYRLAFAVIMLNTDVHNPLAEHMLGRGTFVDMNSDEGDEGGEAVPALAVEELHAIYDRVCAQVRHRRRHAACSACGDGWRRGSRACRSCKWWRGQHRQMRRRRGGAVGAACLTPAASLRRSA